MARSAWEKLHDYRHGLPAIIGKLRTLGFAQYSEDVLLYQLNPQGEGFYIDVGAFHPWQGSNTYKLYLRGWHGITIEPNPDAEPLFRKQRPRDTHLTIGIAHQRDTLTFHRFSDGRLNSFDPAQAQRMRATPRGQIEVPCLPLSDVIEQHANGRQVDLLSVDCEGLDLAVLTSLDLATTRPRVIVVEDFDQFKQNNSPHGRSDIQAHLMAHDYVVVAQGLFSFLYVDAHAMTHAGDTGFRLDQAQVTGLAYRPRAQAS
ncbi:MAG: FkbM family methyltransferase [Pseudomonadota bacterium]